MGMSEDDKRNCCLVEIQETEAKYYKTLEDIEKVSVPIYVRLCEHVHLRALLYVYSCLGTSSVASEFPFVACSSLVSQPPRPGLNRKMSAIGRFTGEHKCHKSRSIRLLLTQPPQEMLNPGLLSIDSHVCDHRRKDINVNMHILTCNKCCLSKNYLHYSMSLTCPTVFISSCVTGIWQ